MNDFARKPSTSAMLSPAQVAGLTNLSRAAVYRAIERGELQASRLCGRLRVDSAELEAWKARSAVQRQRPRNGRSGPDAPTQAHLPSSMSCSRLGEEARERLAYARPASGASGIEWGVVGLPARRGPSSGSRMLLLSTLT